MRAHLRSPSMLPIAVLCGIAGRDLAPPIVATYDPNDVEILGMLADGSAFKISGREANYDPSTRVDER